jgi:large subunit ribosomal protein L33
MKMRCPVPELPQKRVAFESGPHTFRSFFENHQPSLVMPREHIILECTEARAEGKPVSRYMSSRDKKQQPDRVEKKKYNKFLRRHTVHREIKS